MKDIVQEMPLDGVMPSRKILRMALDAALLSEDLSEALRAVAQMQRHGCRVSVSIQPYIHHDRILLPATCQVERLTSGRDFG